jgi:hypothetical protein
MEVRIGQIIYMICVCTSEEIALEVSHLIGLNMNDDRAYQYEHKIAFEMICKEDRSGQS